MSDDALADRSWAVPVIGFLAVAVVVAVLGGGLFVLGTMSTCACSPPTGTATPDRVYAEADVRPGPDDTVTARFADDGNAAALLVVFGNETRAPPVTPTGGGAPSTATSPGTSAGAGSTASAATASPAAVNATYANGSVAVVAADGAVVAADRGLRLEAEGSSVRLSVDANVTVRVVALPRAGSDLDPRVVASWNGTP